MKWHYQLVRFPDGDHEVLIVCEVYRNEDGTVHGRNSGATIVGKTRDEVLGVLARIHADITQRGLLEHDDAPVPLTKDAVAPPTLACRHCGLLPVLHYTSQLWCSELLHPLGPDTRYEPQHTT